ncbi:unnamed protein product [Ostreobium quekettii]|uniref:Exonuclease domain-containing protein n=1 Tax=Ostreobium quekettii TaxID=121088 RepID=A0A8S1IT48_9CHLO|nr:unnamed protein product [Ostreobium quekettii]|eukprot:evm.model.scf_2955.1 EVM.evm.TU.scf_2955.1   scf_2955:8942-11012(+)
MDAPTTADDFLVLIVDTETTGLSVATGELIEVGAILYSVRSRCVLSQVSTLLPPRRGANDASAINQIPVAAALSVGKKHADIVCEMICAWAAGAKFVVSHNVDFDRGFIAEHRGLASLAQKVWLCTCYDFQWPKQHRPAMNLVHLALAHGIGVTCAHRALSDCQLIASLFSAVEDLPGLISKAARPKCRVVALVDYAEREKAKEAGFRWDATSRTWSRWLAIDNLPKLPFMYTMTEVDPRGNESIMWVRLWQLYICRRMGECNNREKGQCRDHVAQEEQQQLQEIGQRAWKSVKMVPSLRSAIRQLWADSKSGSIEPVGLTETMGPLEMWSRYSMPAAQPSMDSCQISAASSDQESVCACAPGSPENQATVLMGLHTFKGNDKMLAGHTEEQMAQLESEHSDVVAALESQVANLVVADGGEDVKCRKQRLRKRQTIAA